MKLVNHTKLDDAELKQIVKWLTKGITRRISTITVSYTRHHKYNGRMDFGFKMPIKVAIAKQETGVYPFTVNDHRHEQFNFPVYQVNNETENCLAVLAHEIHHVRGRIFHRRSTNKMAEAFASKKLEKFKQKSFD